MSTKEETDQFIMLMSRLSNQLNQNIASDNDKNAFLSFAETSRKMPSFSENEQEHRKHLQSFLTLILTFISIKENQEFNLRAQKLLLRYLQKDQAVLNLLTFNKRLTQVLFFEPHLTALDPTERSVAEDICILLVQQYSDIDFSDFSEDQQVIKQLQRKQAQQVNQQLQQVVKDQTLTQLSNEELSSQIQQVVKDHALAQISNEDLSLQIQQLKVEQAQTREEISHVRANSITFEEFETFKKARAESRLKSREARESKPLPSEAYGTNEGFNFYKNSMEREEISSEIFQLRDDLTVKINQANQKSDEIQTALQLQIGDNKASNRRIIEQIVKEKLQENERSHSKLELQIQEMKLELQKEIKSAISKSEKTPRKVDNSGLEAEVKKNAQSVVSLQTQVEKILEKQKKEKQEEKSKKVGVEQVGEVQELRKRFELLEQETQKQSHQSLLLMQQMKIGLDKQEISTSEKIAQKAKELDTNSQFSLNSQIQTMSQLQLQLQQVNSQLSKRLDEFEKKFDNRLTEINRFNSQKLKDTNINIQKQFDDLDSLKSLPSDLQNLKKQLEDKLKQTTQHAQNLQEEVRTDFNKQMDGLKKEIKTDFDSQLTDQQKEMGLTLKKESEKREKELNLLQKDINTQLQHLKATSEQSISLVEQKLRQSLKDQSGKIEDQFEEQLSQASTKMFTKFQHLLSNQAESTKTQIHKEIELSAKATKTEYEKKIEQVDRENRDFQAKTILALQGNIHKRSDGQLEKRTSEVEAQVQAKLQLQIEQIRSELMKHSLQLVKESESKSTEQQGKQLNSISLNLKELVEGSIKDSRLSFEKLQDTRTQEIYMVIDRRLEKVITESQSQTSQLVRQRLEQHIDVISQKTDQLKKEVENKLQLTNKNRGEFLESVDSVRTLVESKMHTVSEQIKDFNTQLHSQADLFQKQLELQRNSLSQQLTQKLQLEAERMHSELRDTFGDLDKVVKTDLKTRVQTLQQRIDQSDQRLQQEVKATYAQFQNSTNQLLKKTEQVALDSSRTLSQDVTGLVDKVEKQAFKVDKEIGRLKAEQEDQINSKTKQLQESLLTIVKRNIDDQAQTLKAVLNQGISDLKRKQETLVQSQEHQGQEVSNSMQKIQRLEKGVRDTVQLVQGVSVSIGGIEKQVDQRLQTYERQVKENENIIEKFDKKLNSFSNLQQKLDLTLVQFQQTQKQASDSVKSIADMQTQLTVDVYPLLQQRGTLLKELKQNFEMLEEKFENTKNEITIKVDRNYKLMESTNKKSEESDSDLRNKLYELQREVKLQVERGINELTSKQMQIQKELGDQQSEIRLLVREFQSIQNTVQLKQEVMNEVQAELKKKEEFTAQEFVQLYLNVDGVKKMVEPTVSLTKQMNQVKKEVEEINQRSLKSESILVTVQPQINEIKEELAEIDPKLRNFEYRMYEVDKISGLVDESNQLWQFYQKFIDEQGLDQVKLIRSKDADITAKLQSLEWVIRYTEFITPDLVHLSIQSFREIYINTSKDESLKYVQHEHNSEAVQTCLTQMSKLYSKLEGKQIASDAYDEHTSILLMALEPLIVNNYNLDLFLKVGGLSETARVMMEQEMPSEVKDKYQKGFIKPTFYYSLRVLATAVRLEEGATKMMENLQWVQKIITILTEWKDKEVVANSLRIINRILKYKETKEKLMRLNATLGNTLLTAIKNNADNREAVFEAVVGLGYIALQPVYVRPILPGQIEALYQKSVMNDNLIRPEASHVLKLFKESKILNPKIEALGGVYH